MCRMVTFSGTCPRCAHAFTWHDLTQELSCLEAKNAGVFGECRRGALVEAHSFDQECDACAADEGVGGLDDDYYYDYNHEYGETTEGEGKEKKGQEAEDHVVDDDLLLARARKGEKKKAEKGGGGSKDEARRKGMVDADRETADDSRRRKKQRIS
ncbi:hypothetical protein QBC33DRAFT_510665 [Phialemonium atrogriseum]|uniref:Uncharacterized protein n=1 Tax=Phialemonium atrogriseum TaxID=1093897 RepID=A0AAJ0C9X8_9PEZI|nr:uncharacterized protein QBC33DRAFT_510665 [Phialemonium atrogriseum]KAK1772850.1 hypothetical protein QBC33DRAFT_510665 [Phialemonium atrogriseum]